MKYLATITNELHAERQSLLARLANINEVIQAMERLRPRISRQMPRGRRLRNKIKLKTLIDRLLAKRPMKARELMEEVLKTGYKFKTDKPIGSIAWIIYRKNDYKRLPGHRYTLAK